MPSTREDYERAAAFHRERCEAAGPHDPEGCGYCHTAALLQEAAERMTWRLWADRPRDGREVLGLFGDRVESVWCLKDGGWHWMDGDHGNTPPTHWLPLPPAPGEPSAEEGG